MLGGGGGGGSRLGRVLTYNPVASLRVYLHQVLVMLIYFDLPEGGAALLDLSLPMSPNSPTRGKQLVANFLNQPRLTM